MKEGCTKNLREKKYLLGIARKPAVEAIYQNQKMVVRLNKDIEDVCQDLTNVQVYYLKERQTILLSFVESLLRENLQGKKFPSPR